MVNEPSRLRVISELTEQMKALLEKAVGPGHAARMYESRPAAESYLTHVEPSLRAAAMRVLAMHWGPDDPFQAVCQRLLSEDPDRDVRSLALRYLSMCCRGTNNARLGKLAAGLVYATAEPRELRMAAYELLFDLRGFFGHPPRPASLPAAFPEDVDWSFVDSFLYKAPNVQIVP